MLLRENMLPECRSKDWNEEINYATGDMSEPPGQLPIRLRWMNTGLVFCRKIN